MITQMKDSGVEGYVQMGGYPIDAVPYAMFAKLIGRKESSVKAMIESNKLPVVHWIKPGSQKGARADSWVYLPAFNAGMQAAFFKKQKEQRDEWLSWLGL